MSNEAQSVDYSAVLADLEARKIQIESAIAVIKGLVGGGGLPPLATPVVQPPPSNSAGNGTSEIQSDTFFNLSIGDATKKLLAMRKRPVAGSDIIEALRRGGQIHASKDGFGNTLGSVLSRSHANNGPIVRVGRGTWGLREWYGVKSRPDGE